jgi:hypothetical protein
LAEAWTGGCYPLTAAEIQDFPFPYSDLAPHYDEVARRIGITGEQDDLARFLPMHDHLLPPLQLDRHSQVLMESYGRMRGRLNRAGAYMGRTRVATLSRALGGRIAEHRKIARVTFPIWIYVSITGVVVYLMLYQM